MSNLTYSESSAVDDIKKKVKDEEKKSAPKSARAVAGASVSQLRRNKAWNDRDRTPDKQGTPKDIEGIWGTRQEVQFVQAYQTALQQGARDFNFNGMTFPTGGAGKVIDQLSGKGKGKVEGKPAEKGEGKPAEKREENKGNISQVKKKAPLLNPVKK